MKMKAKLMEELLEHQNISNKFLIFFFSKKD